MGASASASVRPPLWLQDTQLGLCNHSPIFSRLQLEQQIRLVVGVGGGYREGKGRYGKGREGNGREHATCERLLGVADDESAEGDGIGRTKPKLARRASASCDEAVPSKLFCINSTSGPSRLLTRLESTPEPEPLAS